MALSELYQNVLIEYRENTNDWRFELGGREKIAPSLKQAKGMVDKVPKPKREAVRFKAYILNRLGAFKFEETTVGAASKDYRGRPQFWTSGSNGRSKEDADRLFKINDANNAVIIEINELTKHVLNLQSQREEKIALLERIDIPAEDAGDNHAKD